MSEWMKRENEVIEGRKERNIQTIERWKREGNKSNVNIKGTIRKKERRNNIMIKIIRRKTNLNTIVKNLKKW